MSANFNAAPVFSNTVPIIAPKIITIPMLLKVLLNPSPIIAGILLKLMSAISANAREVVINARNGWTFSFEIIQIIMMMAITKQIIKAIPLIEASFEEVKKEIINDSNC